MREAAALAHRVDDAAHLVTLDRGARGVGRRRQQHAARARAPGRAHRTGVELEALRGMRRQHHRTAARRGHEVPVAGIARVRHQHLVALVEQRQRHQLQRRRGTRGDHDALGRHFKTEAGAVPAGDGPPQRRQPGGMGVLGATVGQALLRRMDHPRRCREVRLADVQVDHRPASLRRVAQRPAGDLVGRLGALHHVERLDVIEPRGELHVACRAAPTSTGRRSAATLSSTPLT
jgi:hypothetical protein